MNALLKERQTDQILTTATLWNSWKLSTHSSSFSSSYAKLCEWRYTEINCGKRKGGDETHGVGFGLQVEVLGQVWRSTYNKLCTGRDLSDSPDSVQSIARYGRRLQPGEIPVSMNLEE